VQRFKQLKSSLAYPVLLLYLGTLSWQLGPFLFFCFSKFYFTEFENYYWDNTAWYTTSLKQSRINQTVYFANATGPPAPAQNQILTNKSAPTEYSAHFLNSRANRPLNPALVWTTVLLPALIFAIPLFRPTRWRWSYWTLHPSKSPYHLFDRTVWKQAAFATWWMEQ
jgi:ABC-type sugar transport system permease subunit